MSGPTNTDLLAAVERVERAFADRIAIPFDWRPARPGFQSVGPIYTDRAYPTMQFGVRWFPDRMVVEVRDYHGFVLWERSLFFADPTT